MTNRSEKGVALMYRTILREIATSPTLHPIGPGLSWLELIGTTYFVGTVPPWA
jgi:hypothetical protein